MGVLSSPMPRPRPYSANDTFGEDVGGGWTMGVDDRSPLACHWWWHAKPYITTFMDEIFLTDGEFVKKYSGHLRRIQAGGEEVVPAGGGSRPSVVEFSLASVLPWTG